MRSSNKNMRTRYEGTIVTHGRRCSQGRISSIGHYVRLTRGWPTLSQATEATLSTHDSWPGPAASSAQKDATAHSALSFATGPNRRISRQREAPAVGLDASACAERRSECVIRDQPRTNRPSRPLFFVHLLSQGLILRVPGHVGQPDRGQSLRQHPSSYHRISIPSQETDGG